MRPSYIVSSSSSGRVL